MWRVRVSGKARIVGVTLGNVTRTELRSWRGQKTRENFSRSAAFN